MEDLITVYKNDGFGYNDWEGHFPRFEVVVEDKAYFQAESCEEIGKKLAGILPNLTKYHMFYLKHYCNGYGLPHTLEFEQDAYSYKEIIDGFNKEKGDDNNAEIQEKADA